MKVVGFLRGVNVGGHHKVPMADLRKILEECKCDHVKTLLNSGNFVFEIKESNVQNLENRIEAFLKHSFGFTIPVILRKQKEIVALSKENPFAKVNVHKDIRLYVSFFKSKPETDLVLPYYFKDKSFKIISIQNKTVLSVVDISLSTTPNAMDELEKLFGKNITTRNWNTVQKVAEL